MSGDLKACREKHRRLKQEIRRLEAEPRSPATKLKLLVAKRNLQDLIRHMREKQAEAGSQMSRSTAVSQAVNVYARTAQALKTQGK
ncbi:hypothetical protein [Roseibium aggregatum]|uniref:Uncharacterized protein n=1 Tax=Roseibium aggregatum TaxID=187304 RepID=A0A939J1E1_9HYPH|nr:hypothetical protein [Roseibium aggregatum]MBN9672041.1 hypothetical protein [Roseibium aggregatum]